MYSKEPLIMQYFFAELKPASLFLTIGFLPAD